MNVPGVGAITAVAFTATIDDPTRFRHSSSVGAYLGLTPRRYQSGTIDVAGHISKTGDCLLRSYLIPGNNDVAHACTALVDTEGLGRAAGQAHRTEEGAGGAGQKTGGRSHRMWTDGTESRWTAEAAV